MNESSQSDRGNEVVRLLLRCHQIEKELAGSAGLSVDEFYCITQLFVLAPCCVKTLRELLGVSPTRASKLLHNLEVHGYLTRTLAFDDKRKERVALTSKGVTMARSLLQSCALSYQRLLKALPQDLTQLYEVTQTPEES